MTWYGKIVELCRVSKNAPPLACYKFDTRERILILFGRNVTHKVSNRTLLYRATSNNLCFCITWQNGKTRKSHFSLKCCIKALPEFNQLLLDFFNLFDSQLILTLPYDSLNLVFNAFSSGLLWGMVPEKGSRERRSSWTQNAPLRCLPERKKCG